MRNASSALAFAILSGIGLVSGDVSALAAEDTSIEAIIPHRFVGDEACFAGDFIGKTLDMQSWPNYAEQAAGRGTTKDLPNQPISRVALYLRFTNGRVARNETWDLDFTVSLTAPALQKVMLAHSGCIWSGWDPAKEQEVEPAFKLGCWIECDGGSLSATRVAGTDRLDVTFSRLFMQSGCEGGGVFSVATSAPSQDISFRLAPVSLATCAPLKRWEGD